EKKQQLLRAQREAGSASASLSVKHETLERHLGAEKPATVGEPSERSREESKAALKTTKRNSADRKALTTLDKRIDTEKRLADVYGQWSDAVTGEQWSLFHNALRGVLLILAIAITGILVNDWLKRILGRMSIERRRVGTLRTATRVALQIIGVLA